MKTFTLEEAQSLLPILESLLKRAIECKRAADAIDEEQNDLARRVYLSGGMRIDVGQVGARRAEAEKLMETARETLAEIDEIGVQVKDLETGLLDFPCRVGTEEDIVLLCWKMGESSIEHWHTVESGFGGRQPVDARFRRRAGSNTRLN